MPWDASLSAPRSTLNPSLTIASSVGKYDDGGASLVPVYSNGARVGRGSVVVLLSAQ